MRRIREYASRLGYKLKRICKYFFSFNWKLLGNEIVLPFRKLAYKLRGKMKNKKDFMPLLKGIKGKRVFIFPPTIDWHIPLFQRPQQLAQAYGKKSNSAVIYLTVNHKDDDVATIERVQENVWLCNTHCLSKVIDILKQAKETVLSISWTINKEYLDKINPDKFIYEFIDDLNIFHLYSEEMEKDHRALLKRADLTVCTADRLYDQVKDIATKAMVSTNGGDYTFFAHARDCKINDLIAEKIRGYDVVLGYYGALAIWFDYAFVIEMAKKKPNWLWILLGQDYDGTIQKSGIFDFDNILYIPAQPYKELPSFLTAFDIATIPFIINEITLSTSPVKLFEYMAGKKPIIASKMPECLKYGSVKTYIDADEFIAHAEELVALKKDDPYWDILEKEALANTWDAKTDEILNALYQ